MGAVETNINPNTPKTIFGELGSAPGAWQQQLQGRTKTPNNALGIPGAAPDQANVQQGTSVGDVQGAQRIAGNSLQSQNALLTALQRQNGMQQQNAVAKQQNNLNSQLNAANGVGTQNSAIAGLQNTAGMYQNIANGTGPNPAQAMLNQTTGQNVANQAALMAGQRGAGANVGLLARQAAMQGAGTQQQAVGQGATMQAQQQLNALSGLTGTQQAIGGLGSGQLAAQQAQQGALANQANTVAGQEIAGTTANTQANLENQQQMQNALQGINQSNVTSQSSVNAANAGLAQSNAQGKQGLLGGLMNGVGGVFSAIAGAEGGEVRKMAVGGDPGMGQTPTTPAQHPAPAEPTISAYYPSAATPSVAAPPQSGPSSSFGNFLKNWSDNQKARSSGGDETPINMASNEGSKKESQGLGSLIGGIVGLAAAAAAKGGMADRGGFVNAKTPAQRAVKAGNSYANDKIPAMLSEGEIVIPREVLQSRNPVRGSADFVAKVLAKRGR